MMNKGLSVFFASLMIVAVLSGCGLTKNATSRSESGTGQLTTLDYDDEELQPEILLLNGTISYDSAKAVYNMAVENRMRVSGFLNLENGPVNEKDVPGLNYVQLAQDSTVLSIHRMDNPLVQQMEYHDGDSMGRKTVHFKEAPFYMRLQLNPLAYRILFRNGGDAIMTLGVKDK